MLNNDGVVAYFTPEVALDDELHTYSGGLGVVAGDFLRSAQKLGLPVVGVTILPRQGYYDQYITRQNTMGIRYMNRYYDGILENTGVTFVIKICGAPVHIKVWRLKEGMYGSSPVLFLDTDIEENDELSRKNTMQLYGGSREQGSNMERRIAQSMVLGIGGVEALRRLGIKVKLYHLNESHSAFAGLYLLYERLKNGENLQDGWKAVRNQIVFTTHTPVEAGNPKYDLPKVEWMLGMGDFISHETMIKIGSDSRRPHIYEYFDMAAACIRLSRKFSAVSKRHFEIVSDLSAHISGKPPLVYVTNGVSTNFWQDSDFAKAQSHEDLQRVKLEAKRRLLRYIAENTGKYLSESVMLITWARRWAEYKRPDLILRNFEWIKDLLVSNKIQLVFAGKPHPDDTVMVNLFNHFLWLSTQVPNLVMLSGYELNLSKILKAGSDVWLNTPRAPQEASGTSGMSAQMEGTIHNSTLDGWTCEAKAENCFIFGAKHHSGPAYEQDEYDAEKLRLQIPQIMELYYQRKDEWYNKALAAKLESEAYWNSDRMVRQYIERLYA
ncbi:MAG: hypothetical protein A3B96_04420 [Candidatus Spechtbacteria bacterium RIFCSPHIGHO2_02_FULL_43_15b]|nr:MAG: hypothetical protein A3B96_04420 [Candidatus Spechtbacteria bacterium RIFCSPHIGHO2_02_FULL_43_15b]